MNEDLEGLPVRIWCDNHTIEWVFARTAEEARQWGIEQYGFDPDEIVPAEEWTALDDDDYSIVGYEDAEDAESLPEGAVILYGTGPWRVKAKVSAWVAKHMAEGGDLPWMHATTEY